MKPVFLDCESAGLRGEILSAALIDPDGEILFAGYYRHPDLETNNWLRENVEPGLSGNECNDRSEFLERFSAAWRTAKNEFGWEPWGPGNGKALACVAHMGGPVESNFFQQLFEAGFIGEFDGPYPQLDTAPLLFAAGCDPTSEQGFAEKVGIEMPHGFNPHSAASDAELTRLVWNYLIGMLK